VKTETLARPDLSNGKGLRMPLRSFSKPTVASTQPERKPIPEQQLAVRQASGAAGRTLDGDVVELQLTQAESCLAEKRYDCALAKGQAAKRQDPGNERARRLIELAHAARQKALESIQIE
jgi:hypothetical protein